MNKRRRAILDAMAPAVEFAMSNQPQGRDWTQATGLSMRARVSAEAPAELMIYGRIGGGGWFSDGISAADVAAALKEIGPGPVDVRINSGGGDVFDGVAIHSLLARHPGTVNVYVDGLAASAASFIMLAGDRVHAARNSLVMIHDAMTMTFGAASAHQRAIDLLIKVSDNIADMYAERAGEDAAYWRARMTENGEDGVWYTGTEAYDAGLVDEIVGSGQDGEDEDVQDYLSGWVDLLPREIAASVSARILEKESSTEQEQEQPSTEDAAIWNRATFTNLLKEVLA